MEHDAVQLAEILNDFNGVDESYVLIREVRLFLDVGHDYWKPDIRIKVWVDGDRSDAIYSYTISHHVHTPDQAGPYHPSRISAETEEAVLKEAINATRSFLRGAISKGQEPEDAWLVVNQDY